jgi:hypothetical protein
MALTDPRYEEIDAALLDMHNYLVALSTELVEASSLSGMRSPLYQMVITSANQLAHLRVAFEVTREHARLSEEIRRRLSAGGE